MRIDGKTATTGTLAVGEQAADDALMHEIIARLQLPPTGELRHAGRGEACGREPSPQNTALHSATVG